MGQQVPLAQSTRNFPFYKEFSTIAEKAAEIVSTPTGDNEWMSASLHALREKQAAKSGRTDSLSTNI